MCQLVFEFGVGIAVLVRCFADRRATENHIKDRLGDGFSLPPFATVVVCGYFFSTEMYTVTYSIIDLCLLKNL